MNAKRFSSCLSSALVSAYIRHWFAVHTRQENQWLTKLRLCHAHSPSTAVFHRCESPFPSYLHRFQPDRTTPRQGIERCVYGTHSFQICSVAKEELGRCVGQIVVR